MKELLIVYLYLTLIGYKIGVAPSERPIDEKDCELWKYHDSQAYRWCLKRHEPEIIRETK